MLEDMSIQNAIRKEVWDNLTNKQKRKLIKQAGAYYLKNKRKAAKKGLKRLIGL